MNSIKTKLIGLVVEGSTEYEAIPNILYRLGVRYTRPSCIHGQPVCTDISVLVEYHLLSHVRVQLRKGASKVIVVLDLEDRNCSPQEFRQNLLAELRTKIIESEGKEHSKNVDVVVCNNKFENWLIADPKGLLKSNYIARSFEGRVRCHADGKDALSILKFSFRKEDSYNKAIHGPRLAEKINVENYKKLCSESLRQFIEIVHS